MKICKEHPEDMIRVNLANKLCCGLCGQVVEDYIVYRTDKHRRT